VSTDLKAKLAGLIITIIMLASAPAASAYVPGLGTGPNYCGAAENGGYNLSGNPQIDGVYACGPLPYQNGGGPAIPTFWPLSGLAGGFQCTEFAQRYLYTVTKGDLAHASSLSGANYVSTASSEFGFPTTSSASGRLPQPGDIISEWGDAGTDPVGHVAVVIAVNASSITTLAENETGSGVNTISIHNPTSWSVNGNGYYHYTHFEWLTPSSNGGGEAAYETAFQANTSSLIEFGSGGNVGTTQGMMAGTSPSIAALPGGGYEMAFQANTGKLIVYGTAGNINTQQGMKAGTSPSIAASPQGGFEVAFQANTGNLYTFNSASGPANMQQGMDNNTSPSIAP
jgi:hypothetical protein